MTNEKINQVIKKVVPKIIGRGLNSLSYVAPKKASDIALDIFRTPRKGRIKSYQKKFLNTFDSKVLDYNGMNVMTYSKGEGSRSILLCHGWESNSFRWRKLVRHLKNEDLRIIMVDAPAHGDSGSEKFDAVLYKEFIKTAVDYYEPDVLIGHSVGGYATLYYYAHEKPASVKSLVILASPDKFTDISERYFDMVGYNERLRQKYYDRVMDYFGDTPESFSVARYARSIEVPGLIIHDKDDNINFLYEGQAIHENWKNSELSITYGLGHSLQSEDVYEMIREWVI